jgi:hypothetical protein
VNEYQPYIALAGGGILFILGLVSVWRPREFWGQDLDEIEGKKADVRKRLIRRRLQIGTAGFIFSGLAFVAIGLWSLMGW